MGLLCLLVRLDWACARPCVFYGNIIEIFLFRGACPYRYCNRQECCGCTDTTLPTSICESSSRSGLAACMVSTAMSANAVNWSHIDVVDMHCHLNACVRRSYSPALWSAARFSFTCSATKFVIDPSQEVFVAVVVSCGGMVVGCGCVEKRNPRESCFFSPPLWDFWLWVVGRLLDFCTESWTLSK